MFKTTGSIFSVVAISALCCATSQAIAAIATPPSSAPTHATNKAPGQNFNLSQWKLQTGTGSACSPGVSPIGSYTSSHFFTNTTDGSMTMVASGKDCLTTNSTHPRTELRDDSSGTGWTSPGTHVLDAWVSVTGSNTIVGQIHPDSGGGNYPLLKCYYTGSGLHCTMEASLSNGGIDTSKAMDFANLPQNKPFFYRITYAGTKVCVSAGANPTAALAAQKCQTPDSSFLKSGLLNYFKAGNYNQGSASATVKVYYIAMYHGA
ncbi:MAG: Alginate lyase 2 [Rhodocyclales bacterium]|nr:Alginate lyase 2 [Rhodocyclales bacterium]